MSSYLLHSFDFCHVLTPYGVSQLFEPPIEEETAQRWLEGKETLPAWAEARLYQWSLKFTKHHHNLLVKLRNQPEEKLYYIHYESGLFSAQAFGKLQPGDKAFFSCKGLYFYCYQSFQSLLQRTGLTDCFATVSMYEPHYKQWLKERNLKHLRRNLLRWAEEEYQKHGSRLIHPECQKQMIWEQEVLPHVFDSYQKAVREHFSREKTEDSALKKKEDLENNFSQEMHLKNHQTVSTPLKGYQRFLKALKKRLNQKLCLVQLDVLFFYISLKSVGGLVSKPVKHTKTIHTNHTAIKEPQTTSVIKEDIALPLKRKTDEQGQENSQEHQERVKKIHQFFEERKKESEIRKAFFRQHPMKEVALYSNIDWSNPEEYASQKTVEGVKKALIACKQEAYLSDYPTQF